MAFKDLQILFDYLFSTAGKVADFGNVQTPAHEEFDPLVVFDVSVDGFLAVVDLPGDVRGRNFLLVQLNNDPCGLFRARCPVCCLLSAERPGALPDIL